ncbi:AfsR/SARP family transcriptional regulator [Streptomyces sp. 3214.6]|uniref:AfsR/SARP family transcriptional regulator n=1 Tax=Streptomyces sp. 3214.6 TaxID=1882757 RepID=UPI00090C42AD|nr:AfsR/SARP family transcriptional regulator [Streptomyces sp. 3214.6]SHI49810.1 DNA-binding transcriptional activator of the SARP family [Streptomyces sp. 3214.6]
MPGEALRFEVLGPVRVWREGLELDVGFPQQRALLALLLTQAGRTVPMGEILDVLWAERPPASAPNVVRRYAGALRRLLEPGLPPRASGRRLLRRTGGYLLEAATDEVDLLRFRDLTRQGRRAAATGRAETAARAFALALGEWRGQVAMGIPASVREHVRFTAVQRELLDTARSAADAALLCGRAEQVLPVLRRAAAHDPLDEPLHAGLVLVLAACGLQAEALRTYEDVRRRLLRDLGIAPGAELAAAHTRVLRQEVGRRRDAVEAGRATAATAPAAAGRLDPAAADSGGADSAGADSGSVRLPLPPRSFVGRADELAWLDAEAEAQAGGGGGAKIVVVGGMAGVGKSALALHWAHRAADRFPDGLLYVALRGFDPAGPPVESAEALRGLLASLGAPTSRMPDGVDALTGMYRTLLAGRRVLVVLDDAVGTEPLRPLLPVAPGCLALVTSRHALPGLVASGARPLRLAPPSAEDARALLAGWIGAERVAAEPRAVDEIVARCGRLPLALADVAARAVGRPDLPLAAPAAELREAHGGLDALSALRPAFLSSHRRLPDDTARLFRQLPRHPGPDLTPATAAALTGLPVRRTRLLLARLAESHLLAEPTPGRYTLHDLLRALAAELAATDERPAAN